MKLFFSFLCLIHCSISLGFNVEHGGKVPIPTDGKEAQMIASLAIGAIGNGAKLLGIINAWRQTVAGQKYIEDIEIRFPLYEVLKVEQGEVVSSRVSAAAVDTTFKFISIVRTEVKERIKYHDTSGSVKLIKEIKC